MILFYRLNPSLFNDDDIEGQFGIKRLVFNEISILETPEQQIDILATIIVCLEWNEESSGKVVS